MKEVNLNLACGEYYLKNWINIDNDSMYPDIRYDIKADIFKLEWEKNTVNNIILSHFMMYIHPKEAHSFFSKLFSWLKTNGKLSIETNDLKAIARHILSSNDPKIIENFNGVKSLYGWDYSSGHKWCWCE